MKRVTIMVLFMFSRNQHKILPLVNTPPDKLCQSIIQITAINDPDESEEGEEFVTHLIPGADISEEYAGSSGQ
jgi:hypothetical protein